MPYSQELLHSAIATYQLQPQTQANLRRAVSTAYYALFHFLIDEACNNWVRPEQRGKLARIFEHKQMSAASKRRIDQYKNAARDSNERRLHSVAFAFHELQEKRHTADYDLSETLSENVVNLDILSVRDAFDSWNIIQNEQIAQDYLFSLLFKER